MVDFMSLWGASKHRGQKGPGLQPHFPPSLGHRACWKYSLSFKAENRGSCHKNLGHHTYFSAIPLSRFLPTSQLTLTFIFGSFSRYVVLHVSLPIVSSLTLTAPRAASAPALSLFYFHPGSLSSPGLQPSRLDSGPQSHLQLTVTQTSLLQAAPRTRGIFLPQHVPLTSPTSVNGTIIPRVF